MILNLLILAFVIGMAVMWATYGLFSSLMHLLVVITAGALAFAFWELWVYKLLFGVMPAYAWGVGLVAPFAVFLIALRVALDSLVRGNVRFPRLADQIVGAALGAASGVLTAGVAVIGIGFLPLPPAVAGYQSHEVRSDGEVVPVDGGGLWLAVDRLTANFYNRLSVGAFGSSTPLAYYLPDAPTQATVFRLARSSSYDENQSLVASPDEVRVTGVRAHPAGGQNDGLPGIGVEANTFLTGMLNRAATSAGASGGQQLVVVETTFKKADGRTFDSDDILRVPPTQVRLSVDPGVGPWELVAPVGFSRSDDAGNLALYPINTNSVAASSLFPEVQLNWVFALPGSARPQFLLVRNTRVPFPAAPESADAATIAGLIGPVNAPDAEGESASPAPVAVAASGVPITAEPLGYTTHKAIAIQQTDALPATVSKNKAQFVNGDGSDGNEAVVSGEGVTGVGAGGRGNSFDRVAVSPSLRSIRLQLAPHTPPPGGTPQGNVQEVWLSTSRGNFRPFAYVLYKGDRSMKMNVLG
ncbi:MAG: CvpA family protein, partial [Planctomycetota bacterium]